MSKIPELFGSMVFNDATMREKLPKDTYKALKQTIHDGKPLDISVANVVANAMKDWALEKGATHFTHWFQPMTGITAEKHDAFIAPSGDGKIIMEFSGKELVRGEPDASSFPSGGLRATFEARGYTAWDPTSYAFIKGKCLCIPTAFCSFGGETLDKKIPLLRSIEAINKQGMRIIRLFGNETHATSVATTVGPEQEYFLIDKSVYEKRKDLIYTGRTLFGAHAPKDQQMEDHYFGAIKPRVQAFMNDLNEELWKLGVFAKTEHNEVSPSQHELAPVFTTTNMAVDHNQITMEIMRETAQKHNMVCLLHEKPFEGINGSGKHNNWSLCTNTGVNLLEPGETPYENAQFILFLMAVIKAVDEYQDLLRISVASASNDHRLGANEAPPAIVSIFIGEELESILNALEQKQSYSTKAKSQLKIGVDVLPKFPKDTTDRNRTSPFAFTGNKFEFRMPGSSASISGINVVLNTAVAEELRQFADYLEKSQDFNKDLGHLIRKVIREHKRILFSGNGYDDVWVKEAESRGLLNLKTTPDCMPYYIAEKNIKLFESHNVFTEKEVHARYLIHLEMYSKQIAIEANTMLQMAKEDILPAVSLYSRDIAQSAINKKALAPDLDTTYEVQTVKDISNLSKTLYYETITLEKLLEETKNITDKLKLALFYKDKVLSSMDKMRKAADDLETITAKKYWPFPTYGDILFSIS